MLIASISVGDSLVTLCAVQSLVPNEEPRVTYNLTHTDLPTDKTVTISYVGECEALYALAAWIAADEPNGQWFVDAVTKLRDSPMHKYMP